MRLKDTGLTAQELKDMVNKYMVETYERYDFIAERAEGMYLYDEEGNAYLDFYGGVAVNSCGNRNPKVIAGLASVTEILDNNLSENAKEMGEYMKQELAKLPHVKEARGRGLLVGCEYDIPIAVEVKHGCLDRMALITAIGDSVNRMIPPLIVTKKQIDELMLIMRASIEDAAAKYESK